jgi:hypothetical protein
MKSFATPNFWQAYAVLVRLIAKLLGLRLTNALSSLVPPLARGARGVKTRVHQ